MTEDPEAVDVAFLWDPLSPQWSRRRFLQTMGFMAAASMVGVSCGSRQVIIRHRGQAAQLLQLDRLHRRQHNPRVHQSVGHQGHLRQLLVERRPVRQAAARKLRLRALVPIDNFVAGTSFCIIIRPRSEAASSPYACDAYDFDQAGAAHQAPRVARTPAPRRPGRTRAVANLVAAAAPPHLHLRRVGLRQRPRRRVPVRVAGGDHQERVAPPVHRINRRVHRVARSRSGTTPGQGSRPTPAPGSRGTAAASSRSAAS